ncbi:general substrate transporter [Aspergillus sergii]|uniref:General substrate transporter n=1 Tax=Aspergillus sergii TaxID=1034303 RepID=A0A5N6XK46_9EURO|nr:general substrate transporter [Aspergillus sergii]
MRIPFLSDRHCENISPFTSMKSYLSSHLHLKQCGRSGNQTSCLPHAIELEHVDEGNRRSYVAHRVPAFYTPVYSPRFVYGCVLSASIGGILFGYDTGIISSALVVFHRDLGHDLSREEKQLLTSLTSGGAFIGALIAALTTDAIGRKMVIGLGCIWFTVGSVLASSAYSVALMSIARFIIGVGMGLETMVTPIYISELSPSSRRGRMITVYSLAVTGGQALAYAVGSIFSLVSQGWRYMFAFGAIPALIQVALFPIYPGTPRHLIYRNQTADAIMVLQQIYPHAPPSDIQTLVQTIQDDVNRSVSFDQGIRRAFWSWKQLHTVPSHLRSLITACGLMALQQLSGFNSLMYYSATLFNIMGFSRPIEAGLIVSGTNFIFTALSLKFVDLGRRRLLIGTVWGLPVALAMAAGAFSKINIDTNLELVATPPLWAKVLAIVSFAVFVAFYAIALGNVPWLANEFLALEVRAVGTAMLTMVCWGSNILVSATFLSLVSAISASGAFGLYAGVCFVGWVFIIFTYPETAGLGLESVRQVFEHGFGVRYANQLQGLRWIDAAL